MLLEFLDMLEACSHSQMELTSVGSTSNFAGCWRSLKKCPESQVAALNTRWLQQYSDVGIDKQQSSNDGTQWGTHGIFKMLRGITREEWNSLCPVTSELGTMCD